MQSRVVITVLIGMLAVSTIFAVWPFFGAPWAGGRAVSVATLEERCKEARLTRQLSEDPRYRERYVSAGVAAIRLYRDDMPIEVLRQAEETRYDSALSLDAAAIEYWCNR
jgi:hypothetical protein